MSLGRRSYCCSELFVVRRSFLFGVSRVQLPTRYRISYALTNTAAALSSRTIKASKRIGSGAVAR